MLRDKKRPYEIHYELNSADGMTTARRLHLFYEIRVYFGIEDRLDSVDDTLFRSQFVDRIRPELGDELDHCTGAVDYPGV